MFAFISDPKDIAENRCTQTGGKRGVRLPPVSLFNCPTGYWWGRGASAAVEVSVTAMADQASS
jgi:hypothetical protein